MITLASNTNTVLIYTNLVAESLPELVQVQLTKPETGRTITVDATVEHRNHIYLLYFNEDISANAGQNVFTITSDNTEYYKESALIK